MNNTNNIKNTILLIIRILVGGIIVYSGFTKLMNMDQAISELTGLTGLPVWTVWLVALGELLAGLGVLFGVWTRLATLGVIVIMTAAVYYTGGQDMSALLLLIGGITLLMTGGGEWAMVKDGTREKRDRVTVPHTRY